jgi:hypothetical protein
MIIIRAIDPGPDTSAFVDWDGSSIINYGFFNNEDHFNSFVRDGDIGEIRFINKIFIEQIQCYGMPVGNEIFETVHWAGRLTEQYINANKCVERVPRKDVKLHLCGSCAAKDSNVITAIADRFDPLRKFGNLGKGKKSCPGPLYGISKDIWQALALALTVYDKQFAIKD